MIAATELHHCFIFAWRCFFDFFLFSQYVDHGSVRLTELLGHIERTFASVAKGSEIILEVQGLLKSKDF